MEYLNVLRDRGRLAATGTLPKGNNYSLECSCVLQDLADCNCSHVFSFGDDIFPRYSTVAHVSGECMRRVTLGPRKKKKRLQCSDHPESPVEIIGLTYVHYTRPVSQSQRTR